MVSECIYIYMYDYGIRIIFPVSNHIFQKVASNFCLSGKRVQSWNYQTVNGQLQEFPG